MPITYAELKALLDIDEPDYAALAERAADALKHLRKMVASSDASLASKAVSLAGIIGVEGSVAIVADAAKSREPVVRVAAAHAASLLPDSAPAARVVSKLLDDKDVGVVKFAGKAAARQSDTALAAKAQRAGKRIAAMSRALVSENQRRERTADMAKKKASKKAGGAAKKAAGKTTAKSGGGGMPPGTMTDPPKSARKGEMPSGKME
jgi:hypothetical protein